MTDNEKLIEVKKLIDEDMVTDEQALSYLANAESMMLEILYPYGNGEEELPERFDRDHIQLSVYLINKKGGEFESEHSEGGVTRKYESADMPKDILRRLTPKCGVLGG